MAMTGGGGTSGVEDGTLRGDIGTGGKGDGEIVDKDDLTSSVVIGYGGESGI